MVFGGAMKPALSLLSTLLLFPSFALAATRDVGEIAVIEDTTGAINGGMFLQTSFCMETAKAFYKTHPDAFDGLITFSTKYFNDFQNVQQGTPVRLNYQGIGTTAWNNGAAYGSAAKLSQCVFMASLSRLPNNP